jgi:hypothetical protein
MNCRETRPHRWVQGPCEWLPEQSCHEDTGSHGLSVCRWLWESSRVATVEADRFLVSVPDEVVRVRSGHSAETPKSSPDRRLLRCRGIVSALGRDIRRTPVFPADRDLLHQLLTSIVVDRHVGTGNVNLQRVPVIVQIANRFAHLFLGKKPPHFIAVEVSSRLYVVAHNNLRIIFT